MDKNVEKTLTAGRSQGCQATQSDGTQCNWTCMHRRCNNKGKKWKANGGHLIKLEIAEFITNYDDPTNKQWEVTRVVVDMSSFSKIAKNCITHDLGDNKMVACDLFVAEEDSRRLYSPPHVVSMEGSAAITCAPEVQSTCAEIMNRYSDYSLHIVCFDY